MSTDDLQQRRYDIKARRLAGEAAATIARDDTAGTVTMSAVAWDALAKGLDRELLPGDIKLYAQQYPSRVLTHATALLDDRDWFKRANAGEGA